MNEHRSHEHGNHDHDGRGGDRHDHRGGVVGYVQHFFGGHSHDTADQVDATLEGSAEGIRTLKISLAVLFATAVVQLVVVLASNSIALLGDTLHNFADALTALPLWVAFVVGRRPANDRYTYGYGRAEDLAGIFIVVVITASALVAGYEALSRLFHPEEVHNLALVAVAAVVGFVGNETAARYRIRTGRRIGSAALVADGLHARADGITSLAVLFGAAGVALGWKAADPVIGLVITAAIAMVVRSAAHSIYHRLMDAVDPTLVTAARHAIGHVTGVEDIDKIRVRWIGHRLHAEIEITVAADLRFDAAHAIAHEVEHALLHAVPRLDHATVHASPQVASAGGELHEAIAHHRSGGSTSRTTRPRRGAPR